MPSLELPEKFNVAHFLLEENIKRGLSNKILYYCHEDEPSKCRSITYGEFEKLINKTGNMLLDLGVSIEDRIMILQKDCPEAVAGLLAAIKIGAIPFVANTMLKPEEYEYLLNDSRAKVAIVDQEYAGMIEELKSRSKYLKHIVVFGRPSEGALSYGDLIKEASENLEPADTSRDEVALWQYSSGTTGPPKGVMHAHRAVIYSTDTYYKEILNLNEKDIVHSVSKIFFGFGQGNSIWGPLRWGASAVLYTGRPNPEKILEIVSQYKVTVLFAAPTHYNAMLRYAGLEKYDLSSLRVCVSAGEALPPVIYKRWKEKVGVEILDGLGTTEIFHIYISNRISDVRPGSSGKPVPGYEVRIVKDPYILEEVQPGEIGILMAKGGSIAVGYWNKYEKTKRTFIGEWLNTGDMYYRDEDGYYYYYGRADDMIKSGGVWVSPIEVERVLMEHPAVVEAAAIPSYTEEGLQRVKAFVVLKEGYNPSSQLEEELKNFAKEKLPGYKRPYWIEFVDSLPKTATGKILRYRLRQAELQKLRKEAT